MCCGGNNCGCGGHGHHQKSCGCHEGPNFGHWLWTKDEKIAWLEESLEVLQEDVKAYQDRIAALKAE